MSRMRVRGLIYALQAVQMLPRGSKIWTWEAYQWIGFMVLKRLLGENEEEVWEGKWGRWEIGIVWLVARSNSHKMLIICTAMRSTCCPRH